MIARRDLSLCIAGSALWISASTLVGCSARAAAPDVSYTLLDRSVHRLSEGTGKVRLLSFWATSCSICIQEMPEVIQLHTRFQTDRFELLAVAMSYDPPTLVDDYARTRQLPFGVVIDNTGEIAERFGKINATPTTVLVDKTGRIAWRFLGRPDFVALSERISALLAEA
jgi:peroxiredoxin